MTRTQRRVHLLLWLTLMPLVGVLFVVAVLSQPGPPAIDGDAGSAAPEASP